MKQIQGRFLLQSNKDFPADCEMLDYMQTNAHVVSIIGNLAGDKAILLGCALTGGGTQRNEGYVFLRTKEHPEGEVLYWEGGSISGGMYLKQAAIPVQAQGYEYPQAYVERSLAPGVGEENYKWEDFREAQSLPELEAQIVALQTALAKIQRTPLGMVEIWAGSRIPDGYALCEGQQLKQSEYPELYKAIGTTYNNAYDCNGRKLSTTSGYFRLPDLRGRFVVGYNVSDADYGSYGKVGGEKKHTLTVDEMPSHAHGQNLWTEVTEAGAAAAATLIPRPCRGTIEPLPSDRQSLRAAAVRTRTARPIIRWPTSCGRSKREEMIDTLVLVVILAGSPVDSIGSPEPCAYVRYETKLREASRMAKTSANEHCAKWVEAYFSDLKTLTHTIDSVFRTALPQRERERMNRYLKKYGNGD